MTFSSEVKKELTSLEADEVVLAALIRMNGSLALSNKLSLFVVTENATTARYIYSLLIDIYDIKSEIRTQQKNNLSKNRSYTVVIDEDVPELLSQLDLADGLLLDNGLPESVKYDERKSIKYLRGVFLSSGNVSDPDSGKYQLSMTLVHQEQAEDLKEILHELGFEAKILKRKNNFILYLSKAEQIMDFLTLIGANKARLTYESAKIVREVRNQVNRQVNFETANLTKSISASLNIIDKINLIDKKLGLENIPENLAQIAILRRDNPEATIQDLGRLLNPPLGKSGVNHRLRKLSQMADDLEEKD